jgi:hypothetical protein
VNRVYVRLVNGPVPTGQRDIGTRLLSSFENRHFSNQRTKNGSPVINIVSGCVCVSSISCVFLCWWLPNHGSSVG